MEIVSLPKAEVEQMKAEIRTLRKTNLYLRLLEFEQNFAQGEKFKRKDVGF